ncbi:MAG: efflux RND transporter permease subunit [Candidatus Omnitrophica bacterium]|nr:efflux RND transporter permease subunit [Candidatus Omnitrophota bacterium]
MNLPDFGVKRPVTNLMIFFAILIISLYSLSRLGIDMMPEIEPPIISVIAAYPGASPEDVEIKVTEPLENQLATTPGLEKITSRSLDGVSLISLKFNWGTNLDAASNDIRDRIELSKRFLPDIPDEMDNPFIYKFNTANIPILFVGFTAEKNYTEIYDLIDKKIGDAIRQLPGVGTVQLFGGLERQVNVWLNRERLEGYGFSVQDIENAIRQANITQPLGSIKSGLTDYQLRLPGEFSSPDEMNGIILGKRDGKYVYLKDVARVEDSFKEVTVKVRLNRNRGLMMMVQKQTGTNTVEVSQKVKDTLKSLEESLPSDVKMFIIFDTSQDIISALNTLKAALRVGVVLVILVVWFFLRQFKGSLIIALSIPFSLLIAFVYLFLSAKTINVISLSSLAIACGMVVDNAIVIVDNIYRHLQRGQRKQEAAVFGASEMFLSIAASTLTTVMVFLPLFFVSGVVGIFFGELAVIITVTLIASLFTAVTFSPMLCSKLLRVDMIGQSQKRNGLLKKAYELSEKGFNSLEEFYSKILALCLGHKKTVIFFFLGAFICSLFLARFIGNEFIPEEDSGDVRATVSLALGTRFEETDKLSMRIEDILEKYVPEAKFMYVRPGTTPGAGRAMGAGSSGEHIIAAGVKLVPKQERKRSVFEVGHVLREQIRRIPGVIKVDIAAGNPMGRLITGMGGKAIQLEVIGHSFEETNALAARIKEVMESVPGAVDVSISREISRPELKIAVDREKAAALGLNMNTVASTIKTFIEGSVASKYREKGETYDIFVRLEEASRSKIEDVENLSLVSSSGEQIKLANFARIYEVVSPVEIERQNRERVLRVECNVYQRSAGKVIEDIKKELGKVVVPSGIILNFGGEAEEQAKAFQDLFLLLILGIVLVYMVMAAQFESLLDPFVVMFAVPFTFTGVLLGFLLTRTTLSIITFLGVIMLTGIVVNNAIVLISYINILRARGYSMLEAVTQGGKDRLRPVLMTTLTTLAGMLPLALSRGEGSETWQPLGITMISGLSVSTLITLLFVPTFYALIEHKVKKNSKENRIQSIDNKR